MRLISLWTVSKYEGAGNDFLLIDDRALQFPVEDRKFIQALCHRKKGIGADGVILLQEAEEADFRMRIFNSDGGEAESCGNGLRCFFRFLQDLGLCKESCRIATMDHIAWARSEEERVAVEMGPHRDLQFHLATEVGEVHFVDTGVPHAVHFVLDVGAIDLKTLGPFLRHHPLFQPRGANVTLVALQPDGSCRARTFERGVEGETLACGTGAVAAALVAAAVHSIPFPIFVRFAGGDLEVRREEKEIWLVGPARKVFCGFFDRS